MFEHTYRELRYKFEDDLNSLHLYLLRKKVARNGNLDTPTRDSMHRTTSRFSWFGTCQMSSCSINTALGLVFESYLCCNNTAEIKHSRFDSLYHQESLERLVPRRKAIPKMPWNSSSLGLLRRFTRCLRFGVPMANAHGIRNTLY